MRKLYRKRLIKRLQALGNATSQAEANTLFLALPELPRAVVALMMYVGRMRPRSRRDRLTAKRMRAMFRCVATGEPQFIEHKP